MIYYMIENESERETKEKRMETTFEGIERDYLSGIISFAEYLAAWELLLTR